MAEKHPSPKKRSPRVYVKRKDSVSPGGRSSSSEDKKLSRAAQTSLNVRAEDEFARLQHPIGYFPEDKKLSRAAQTSLNVHAEDEFVRLQHPTGYFRRCAISPLDRPRPPSGRPEEASARVLTESNSPLRPVHASPTARTPQSPAEPAHRQLTHPRTCSQCDTNVPSSSSSGRTVCTHVAQASRQLQFPSGPPPTLPPRRNRYLSGSGYRAFAIELSSDVSDTETVPRIVTRCVQLVDDWCLINKAHSVLVYCKQGNPLEVEAIQAMFAAGDDGMIRSVVTPSASGEIGIQRLFHVNAIAGVLLRYLMELSNPVIPEEMYDAFIAFIDEGEAITSSGKVVKTLPALVDAMPPVHQNTLRHLLAHFSRLLRWQSESGVGVKCDELIQIFATILIRPPWNRIGELPDNVKIHNDIMLELLRQGCWGEEMPELPAPTGLLPPPPANRSDNVAVATSTPEERLLDAPWYWRDISTPNARILMRDQPNGSFLIRNSSTPGDYTLILKFDDVKLIKIFGRDHRYGFVEELLEFPSVPTLVSWYQSNSLVTYNMILKTKLEFPLIRTNSPGLHTDNVIEELEELLKINQRYMKQRQLYKVVLQYFEWYDVDLTLKKQASGAYQDMLNVLQEHIQRHQECPGARANQEIERLFSRCEKVQRAENSLEVEIEQQRAQLRLVNGEISILRMEILQLKQKRKQWMDWLIGKGLKKKFVENLVELRESLWYVDWDRQKADSMLMGKPNGTFLVRCKDGKTQVLSLVSRGTVRHCVIEHLDDVGYGFSQLSLQYSSVQDIINIHHYKSLANRNPILDVCLLYPVGMHELLMAGPQGAASPSAVSPSAIAPQGATSSGPQGAAPLSSASPSAAPPRPQGAAPPSAASPSTAPPSTTPPRSQGAAPQGAASPSTALPSTTPPRPPRN